MTACPATLCCCSKSAEEVVEVVRGWGEGGGLHVAGVSDHSGVKFLFLAGKKFLLSLLLTGVLLRQRMQQLSLKKFNIILFVLKN
jgi:hypothetical protein